jgi:hypothetical protein
VLKLASIKKPHAIPNYYWKYMVVPIPVLSPNCSSRVGKTSGNHFFREYTSDCDKSGILKTYLVFLRFKHYIEFSNILLIVENMRKYAYSVFTFKKQNSKGHPGPPVMSFWYAIGANSLGKL